MKNRCWATTTKKQPYDSRSKVMVRVYVRNNGRALGAVFSVPFLPRLYVYNEGQLSSQGS
jgi:hypothetical protein